MDTEEIRKNIEELIPIKIMRLMLDMEEKSKLYFPDVEAINFEIFVNRLYEEKPVKSIYPDMNIINLMHSLSQSEEYFKNYFEPIKRSGEKQ